MFAISWRVRYVKLNGKVGGKVSIVSQRETERVECKGMYGWCDEE